MELNRKAARDALDPRIRAAASTAERIIAARAALHAQEEGRMDATEINTAGGPPPTPPPARPDVAPGGINVAPSGHARRARLNLDPRTRGKLERWRAGQRPRTPSSCASAIC